MLRDVFYFGDKPNAHPRERPANDLVHARSLCTSDHFWIINEYCDYTGFDWDFDFEFLPDEDVWSQDHNNVWPSVYQKDSGTWLCSKEASTLIVYRNDVNPLKRKNIKTDNWVLLDKVDENKFDFSWHPDPTSPPYIYRWGNKFYPVELAGSIEYRVPGAEQVKYMSSVVELLPDFDRWEIPDYIDRNSFDFTWRPDPREPALIYEFGTQWQDNGGPRYVCEDATEIKYIDGMKARALPRPNDPNWSTLPGFVLEHFDYTWHPDNTSPPFIYVFGNQYFDSEICPTVEYTVPGATEKKYVKDCWGTLGPSRRNWLVPENVDVESFDFSWIPNPYDPPFIYQFGTQWQKTGGPRYVIPDATEIKYVDTQVARALPRPEKFRAVGDLKIKSFDYSWHPDDTEDAYLYTFGNQFHAAEVMPTIQYIAENATEKKFVTDIVATLDVCMDNWEIPENVDASDFDFSWLPDPGEGGYIYQFGTQHQKTGGPRYIVPGATQLKYMDNIKAKALPTTNNWKVVDELNIKWFDYSWHPDVTEEPYIYVFGNQWHEAEKMPTVTYVTPGATQVKYVSDIRAILGDNTKYWRVPENIDVTQFDFSWVPDPTDPPYIYQFGTQWQKDGGPKYIKSPDAVDIKYVPGSKAKALPDKSNWEIPYYIDQNSFDFSWHPENNAPPMNYIFGTQWAESGGPVYKVKDAIKFDKKYIDVQKAIALADKTRWTIPEDVDTAGFDFSWHPGVEDQPYIYEFGTQWQKTGGPKFVTEGATKLSPTKYVDKMRVRKLPNPSRFEIVDDLRIKSFDYSWHPDDTDPPYVYIFGNNQYPAEIMPTVKLGMPNATTYKYVKDVKAVLDVDMRDWDIPENIDQASFDFTWKPNPKDPPLIYQFGTQHQKTGGPRYIVPGATEVKYVDKIVKRLADKSKFVIKDDMLIEEFDWSWHPDESAPPYIYVFGNQHYPAEVMHTIEFHVEGATEFKYMATPIAKLAQDRRNWVIPKNVDVSEFDFSWRPDPFDPPFIYRFGTQWQKTGGPSYPVPKATEVKYIDNGNKAKALPNPNDPRWHVPENIDVSGFDFSWHPDITERPYIYQFGTQWQNTGGPRYVMPGASQIKYISDTKARALPDGTNWDIPTGIDIDSFDFSWHPDETTEKPYIYQFGTQWQKTGGPRYITPGSNENSEVKYVDRKLIKAIKLPNKTNWSIPNNVDPSSVDYTWHPDDTEEPYIYQFGTQWNDRGGPKYTVPGGKSYKYTNDVIGKTIPDKTHWDALLPIDEDKFDYSWVPHPFDPPYIYVFGNQWHAPEIEPTMEYRVAGATEIKYVHELKAPVLPDTRCWNILHPVVEDEFDFSWRPSPKDPPYIYVFGNTQYPAEKMPTIEYHIEGATERKYMSDIVAKLAPVMSRWNELIPIDKDKFDYSWVPDPGDPPYIYVFGNQWHRAEIEPTMEYHIPGATTKKYVHDVVAHTLPNMYNWIIPENIDLDGFDLSWRPDPNSPPYMYEFATVWNNRGGPRYRVDGATDFSYIEDIKAKTKASRKNWIIPSGVNVEDFDFTWVPHPDAPPYIYQFGTLANDDDGPRYEPNNHNNEIVRLERVYRKYDYREDNIVSEDKPTPKYVITTTLEDLINEHKDEIFWAIRENIDYSRFDFNWKPSIEQARYLQVFGSPDSELTQTYFVSASMYLQGYKDLNFVEADKKADAEYLATLFKASDMFFVDRGNAESRDRFEKLKLKYPGIQKTRFLNSWVDTINRCINRADTSLCWILNSEYDYTGFNFNYYPNPWQMNMVHVFGTQWSHWGHTYIVNRETFGNDTKYIKIIEHLNNLNFVKDRQAIATNNLYDIWLIDHGNDLTDVKKVLSEKSSGKNVNVIKYQNSYLETFRNLVKEIPDRKEDYIWLCSSICDYSKFDFSYVVDPFARDNLHVFPSDRQKFGDTFFIDVNKTKEIIEDIDNLQAYHKVNYNQTLRTRRLPAPVIDVSTDTHVGMINTPFDFPYAVFQTELVEVADQEPISLWSADTKNILITSTGGTRIIVPREAKEIVKKELYDYPHIKTASKLGASKSMDIVFLSNGEQCADENYKHLLAVTKGSSNRVIRVDGVDGRVEAYHAALEASNTPWAFTVFAKLKVNPKFDWGWQPDRLQIPKHYIFHAKNPLNGLEYGHQALIAYNKKLTLANTGKGLDFTLDDPHETVAVLSGTATFNTDPYSTWRTAFREVIKLKSDYSDIAAERLKTWTEVAQGDYAEDCLRGAQDAIEFYDEVMGDIEELKKSYEWAWLKDYYRNKYK
jgi:hypothetical protein